MRRRSIVWAVCFQERGSRPSWFAFGGPIARVRWQAKSQPWDVKPPLNRSAGFTERGICLRLSTTTPLAHSPRRRLSQQTDPPRFLSDGPRREWIPSRPAMERSQGKPPPRSIALAATVFLQGQCIRPAPSPGSSHAGSAAHPPSELHEEHTVGNYVLRHPRMRFAVPFRRRFWRQYWRTCITSTLRRGTRSSKFICRPLALGRLGLFAFFGLDMP